MQSFRLFIATGSAVMCIECDGGDQCQSRTMLDGSGAQCIAVDPHDPERVYVGTFDEGIFRTRDGGQTWEHLSDALPHSRVPSVAFSPARLTNGVSAIYAGTEPSNLYRSDDDGATWHDFPTLKELPSAPTWSFPPRPTTSHVRWIAPHYADADLIFVGIELGGVMCSRDGGKTWEDRKPGSCHDSHCIRTHPSAHERVYEAAGEGLAWSQDHGTTWSRVDDGVNRRYGWALAVDPVDPGLWYVSATFSARHAHYSPTGADARIYRKRGDAHWEPLQVGDTATLASMPYALLTLPGCPGMVIAGLHDGQLFVSEDEGDSWRRLPVSVDGLLAMDGVPV